MTIVSASAFGGGSGTSASRSITMIADASRILLGFGASHADTIGTITYNAANMTSIATHTYVVGGSPPNINTRVSWLGNASLPTAGDYNIATGASGSSEVYVAGAVMKLVAGTTPIGYTHNVSTLALTNLPPDCYVLGVCVGPSGIAFEPVAGLSGMTTAGLTGINYTFLWGYAQPGTSSFTFGWTFNALARSGSMSVAVVEVDTAYGQPIWF